MGYILGLDLGITSVGYGIIEEDSYKIIKYGVRLFEEGTADNNLQRRQQRSSRRIKSRRKNRINAIKYLLLNNNIITSVDFETLDNVYELRVKGLTQKLTNLELANVLVNIAKRRGSSLDVAVDEDDKEGFAASSALSKNTAELKKNNLYICQAQLAKIQNGIKLRSHDNIYRSEDYEKELKQILSNQGLPLELNDKIIEIIMRRRNFSEGPGSYEFPTKYGSYRIDYVDGHEVIKHVNLIEEMRGKCSIFKTEPRIAKCSFEACLFNLLNDLNNIKINGNEIITKKQKIQIINDYIIPKGKITIPQLVKFLDVEEKDLSGFRKNSADKNIITAFDTYSKLIKILPAEILKSISNVDLIIEILTKTAVVEERINYIKELKLGLDDEVINQLANMTKVNGYHSLSKKAMDIIIPEMIETNKNQMQIIHDNNLDKNDTQTKGTKIKFDSTSILSPVAKRVHMQAIEVVNELRKEYGEFDSIVIETTRFKNSAEEKKNIQESKKILEEQKRKSDELLLDLEKNPDKYNTLTKLKLRLYKEQDGKTIYAGLPIDLDLLLEDSTAYQIEHIIPYAVSFDNSMNNKALASSKENQDKGKRTPWQYFSSGMVQECDGPIKNWDDFEAFVNSLKISTYKKKNLLDQSDVTKFDNMKTFVARNLSDTSYGVRTVMNTMKQYFKDNDINTKVFTVKGKLTSIFRNRVGLKKNRDYFIHHAVDALIIAGSKNQSVFNNAYLLSTNNDGTTIKSTGEVFDYSQDPFDDPRFLNYISSLKQIEGKPEDFSYKVDRKTNRQFADQTIYSTRNYDGTDYVIKKYKDIYGKEGESLKKLFDDKKEQKLLMAKNDIQTFEMFKKIYENYKNEKNPFAKYKEEFGPIKKYSKGGNGPEIYQVKYIDDKLGNHLDISKKYNVENSNKKVVLLQNSPYRTDVYQSKESGLYKFVTIRRYHVIQKDGYNVIDSDEYQKMLNEKKIDNTYEFKFSLNRNDIINLVTSDNQADHIDKALYRFIGTNNDKKNIIEIRYIEKTTDKRLMIAIGKKIVKFEKYNVSLTGKKSKVEKEVLKLKWK